MKQVEKELPLQNDILQRHNCVLMVWNMKGDEGYPVMDYVSQNISMYGYSAQEYLDGKSNWIDMVYEEDRSRTEQEGSQFLLRASGHLLQEYRIHTKTGKIIWVQADSCYMQGEDMESAYVETAIRNINASKEKERLLLENQFALQQEIFTYMDVAAKKSFKENLIDFIKEQKIETLQAAFAEIYGIHAALIGKDYYFYTRMTGPREETGIFYDVAELRSFRKKVNMLEEILDSGQRNVILSMKNPGIKIAGVPIFYKDEYVATWVMCCLDEKETEDILKILEFMRIMAETISEYYSNHMGAMSAKGYAFERYRLQKKVKMQEVMLELYDEMMDKNWQEKLFLILKKAGETSNSTRCAMYKAVPNSIFARCVSSWMTKEGSFSLTERETYNVQALPNPGMLLKEEPVVINSIRIPQEWNSTMNDLHASAAVLIPVEWDGKTGFLSFMEIAEERVWEEESIWFFKEIKKIIQKVLLKSE